MPLTLIDGNEAAAWGAFDAGCRFFAGYPITPATGVFDAMLRILPPEGGIVLQGEDEIASLGYCLGASMAGLKALTATSGPGISLYSEQISFAIGSEIPVVIIDVQRLGPSTGYATKGADGDIQFLRWGNSGGLPVIVLSPVDARDCYLLTMLAFNLAETYRCPVFIASGKEVAMTRESVDFSSIKRPRIVDRAFNPRENEYKPFRAAPGTDVPYFAAIGGPVISRQTSSMHSEDGYITADPEAISAQVERLKRKLETNVDSFTYYDFTERQGAQTLLITYGVTSRAARAAVLDLEDQGKPVSHLTLKTLWPVPENLIQSLAGKHQRVVLVEANLGQYVREVERILGTGSVEFMGEMDGKLIAPQRIKEAVIG